MSENETNIDQGFYTLSSNSIPLSSFPEQIQKKLPKLHTSIPTTLLGRLAIDKKYDFIEFPGSGKMFIAIKTLSELFA